MKTEMPRAKRTETGTTGGRTEAVPPYSIVTYCPII